MRRIVLFLVLLNSLVFAEKYYYQQNEICPHFYTTDLNVLFGKFNLDKEDETNIYKYLKSKGYVICGKEKLTRKETRFPLEKFLKNISQIKLDIKKIDINKDNKNDFLISLSGVWFGSTGLYNIILEKSNLGLKSIFDDNLSSGIFIFDNLEKKYPNVYIVGSGLNASKWIWDQKQYKYVFESFNEDNYYYIQKLNDRGIIHD